VNVRRLPGEFIPDVGVEPYPGVRASLETGDVIVEAGRSPFARAIKVATRSPWTHVGVVIRVAESDRIMVGEALTEGVVLRRLSRAYLEGERDPARRVFVLRRLEDAPDPFDLSRAFFDELGARYDWQQIEKIASRVILGLRGGERIEDHEWICSELVDHLYREGGAPLDVDADGLVTPRDIASDPTLGILCRLV